MSSPDQEPAGSGQHGQSGQVHHRLVDRVVQALVEHRLVGRATGQQCGDMFDGDQDGAQGQHGESAEQATVGPRSGRPGLAERGLGQHAGEDGTNQLSDRVPRIICPSRPPAADPWPGGGDGDQPGDDGQRVEDRLRHRADVAENLSCECLSRHRVVGSFRARCHTGRRRFRSRRPRRSARGGRN